ncbi:MAG: TolC family protein [Paracoccaceae bacterium]
MPTLCMKANQAGAKRLGLARAASIALTILALSGCATLKKLPEVTKLNFGLGARPDEVTASEPRELTHAGDAAEVRSAIIDDLVARKSILPGSGPFAEIAQSVLKASTGAAVAELRVARLRAEAKSKNWLPSIGPSVNLSSLGAMAASIMLEQVIFDNGQRKAERAFAAADVEIAAVTLSTDYNDRVHDGLAYYIKAERAREQARLADRAVARMTEYERIMGERVEGGLSDRSEQRVITQKLSEMKAAAASDREVAALAMAELNAISAQSMDHLTGLQSLPPGRDGPEALAVLRARGEGSRTVAEAKMERAAHLPGLKASASLGEDGFLGGLRLGADRLLGLGTGSTMAALKATDDVVVARAAEAREDARRRIVALESQHSALSKREVQGAGVVVQTEASLEMFTEQYQVGRRPLMELVGMFETFSRMERDQAALKYDMALLRLAIARERGVLVDGARM